ncbi:FecR domain-containing protein [Thermospira aquatica]|uniref:FecR domain-containing protein n=1 Tax=Thermospira aquatica TaxID=2828656 RepID=A0AAX3BF98_9SPIR|nr:FecR domain-containing protein [Thermospira aquatica]URA11023.1 FecR domain-containing protein [Thermospira aquatica]
MKRFKGQGEKEALVKRLLLSYRDSVEVVPPPFQEFVRRCEIRIANTRQARLRAARGLTVTLRWGLALASVLVVGILLGRFVLLPSFPQQDGFISQMGRVDARSGSKLRVSRYSYDDMKVIHFVLSEGEAVFYPKKVSLRMRYVVETPHMYIRVVGTIFRVSVFSNETKVHVEEGRVWCYPRVEGYTINHVLQGETPSASLVLEEGRELVLGEKKPQNPVFSPVAPSSEGGEISKQKPVSGSGLLAEKKTITFSSNIVSIVAYKEYKGYQVTLREGEKLEIANNGKALTIDLSSWAMGWFDPVLLEDGIVLVSHTGVIVRLSYEGRVSFKLRPIEGRLISPPLVTSRGVILMQPEGMFISLWDGSSWKIPAESDFLRKSLPFYFEKSDVIIYANEPGSIAAYSLKKRDILWTHRLVREFVGAPIRGREEIAYVYGGAGNILVAVDVRDGHFVWSRSLGKTLQWMDIVGDNVVVILATPTGSEVQLLSLQEGDVLSSLSFPGKVKDTLKENGVVYFLTDEGSVFKIENEKKKISLLIKEPSLSKLTFIQNKVGGIGTSGLVVLEK